MIKKSKILITAGNPNGVGPEVTSKALSKFRLNDLSNMSVIIDRQSAYHYFREEILEICSFRFIEPSASKFTENYRFNPGEPTLEAGAMSYLFLKEATNLIKTGEFDALVTAPISKEHIAESGIENTSRFKGHTDFLAQCFDITRYNMMFYSDDLKVILATIHIPLREVVEAVTQNTIEIAVNNAIDFLKHSNLSGNIGVCGINPHCGEGGIIGNEDYEVIAPVVGKYRASGVKIEGPVPADTLFFRALNGDFDIVIAMYHDQGLAPFKLIHFMDGVNVTLGLPFIRTSPNHGTAFPIAGKGVANETSMFNSIRLATQWLDAR